MSELDCRYDPSRIESKWYKSWESNGYFHADENSAKEPYTIVIPPPNITGILHIGHGLNNTIQDVLVRRKRMQGYLALWLPGTDHAGIATQNMVERELLKEGKKKEDLGRDEFLRRVWQWREEKGGTIIEQLKRLGSSCDWERARFTLDEGLSRAVSEAFKRLFDEGLLYKGSYIVNWCPRCLTAIADDEVNYNEIKGKLWHIKYPVAGKEGVYCVVATTRPETMLGDTAVAVNPADERYQNLIGEEAILPLLNRRIKIIADEFVSMEFGTGMVKVTPAHDPNDYHIGKRHNLPEINILHPDAMVNDNGGIYSGLDRYIARKKIVEDLENLGLMEKIEDYLHSVGHCYRCHTAIEPYISKQWFVRMKELAEPAIEAVEKAKTRFAPKMWENTYFHWMRNVRDWCVSRQLWWGHRIPAWYCDACGEITVSIDETPQKCEKCHANALSQDPDVLDTWFSSALWPFSTLGWPEKTKDLAVFYPTSVLVTAHEILFFWVARMIMMGLKFMGDVPFHDVYIHAMVFDEHTKKKMSKSLGNVIDPLEMIDKYGADALRMTLCAYAIKGKNLYLSEERFIGYRNFMNKIWNAARFALNNSQDLTPEDMAQGINEELLTLQDRWILSSFARTAREANAALDEYSFDQLVSSLYHFVWHRYCDWYLELCKPILDPAKSELDDESRALRTNVQRILIILLEGMLRLLHPVIPFITEELWQKIRERFHDPNTPQNQNAKEAAISFSEIVAPPSIMIATWDQTISGRFIDDNAEKAQELVREVIYAVRNIRGEMNIPPGTATDVIINGGEKGNMDILKANVNQLETLLNARELRLGECAPDKAFFSTGVVQDLTLFVVLPDEMRAEEILRLQKELEKTEKETSALEGKMKNENFINKAPEDIVAKTRERLEHALHEKDRIHEQLKKLIMKNEK